MCTERDACCDILLLAFPKDYSSVYFFAHGARVPASPPGGATLAHGAAVPPPGGGGAGVLPAHGTLVG